MSKNVDVSWAISIALCALARPALPEVIAEIAQEILDKAYPPLTGDVGELIAEARSKAAGIREALVHGDEFDHDELADWTATTIERLCDALEAAHSAPVQTKAGDE